MGQDSFQWCAAMKEVAMDKNWNTKFHTNTRKIVSYESNRALEQAVKGGCRVSFTRDIQDLSGYFPVLPYCKDPALVGELDLRIFRGAFPSLQVCDS